MEEVIGSDISRHGAPVARREVFRNSMPGPFDARRAVMRSLVPKTLLRRSCSMP